MKRLLIGILALLLFGRSYSYAITNYGIPRGKVVDTIKCIDNRQQSYALYLPSHYTIAKKYPIIYIFEPAARGVLPVKKYKKLAEEFGFILVCSNNSRNGPQDQTNRAAAAVFTDTKIRFTLDTGRIYTMGFSGGARVATRIAIQQKNIKGVIACGAGFPYQYKPTKDLNFIYVGLIGDLDMNYYEVKILEEQLDNEGMKHYMAYFNEKHVWPSKEEMRKAFVFLHFDAMKNKKVEIDTTYIEDFKFKKLKQLNEEKNSYKKYIGCRDLLKHIDNLSTNDKLKSKVKELYESSAVQEKIKQEKQYLKEEFELSELYGKAFYKPLEYTMQWWKNEAKTLSKAIKDSTNMNMLFIANRMSNKIYLMIFEDYLHNGKDLTLTESVRSFKIAALVKPKSPYPEYYLASIYSKNNKIGQAIKMLQKSIEKGFSNLTYLKQNKSFDNIRDKKKYIELEEQLMAK